MSDSLWPHGLQYTGSSCPSPTPRACSNSCPSSQWCHPTISSSVIPFSSCTQSFPASGSFQMNQFILPTKVCPVKAMVFPVVMYGCESWSIKKAEHRTDAFELWCWRRFLRVPWTARRSNQFIIKEISPEYSLKRPMLKLKLQYFGHLMWRTDSFEKNLMLRKIESIRRTGQQRMWWLNGITNSMDVSLGKLGVGDEQGGLLCCSPWACKE